MSAPKDACSSPLADVKFVCAGVTTRLHTQQTALGLALHPAAEAKLILSLAAGTPSTQGLMAMVVGEMVRLQESAAAAATAAAAPADEAGATETLLCEVLRELQEQLASLAQRLAASNVAAAAEVLTVSQRSDALAPLSAIAAGAAATSSLTNTDVTRLKLLVRFAVELASCGVIDPASAADLLLALLPPAASASGQCAYACAGAALWAATSPLWHASPHARAALVTLRGRFAERVRAHASPYSASGLHSIALAAPGGSEGITWADALHETMARASELLDEALSATDGATVETAATALRAVAEQHRLTLVQMQPWRACPTLPAATAPRMSVPPELAALASASALFMEGTDWLTPVSELALAAATATTATSAHGPLQSLLEATPLLRCVLRELVRDTFVLCAPIVSATGQQIGSPRLTAVHMMALANVPGYAYRDCPAPAAAELPDSERVALEQAVHAVVVEHLVQVALRPTHRHSDLLAMRVAQELCRIAGSTSLATLLAAWLNLVLDSAAVAAGLDHRAARSLAVWLSRLLTNCGFSLLPSAASWQRWAQRAELAQLEQAPSCAAAATVRHFLREFTEFSAMVAGSAIVPAEVRALLPAHAADFPVRMLLTQDAMQPARSGFPADLLPGAMDLAKQTVGFGMDPAAMREIVVRCGGAGEEALRSPRLPALLLRLALEKGGPALSMALARADQVTPLVQECLAIQTEAGGETAAAAAQMCMLQEAVAAVWPASPRVQTMLVSELLRRGFFAPEVVVLWAMGGAAPSEAARILAERPAVAQMIAMVGARLADLMHAAFTQRMQLAVAAASGGDHDEAVVKSLQQLGFNADEREQAMAALSERCDALEQSARAISSLLGQVLASTSATAADPTQSSVALGVVSALRGFAAAAGPAAAAAIAAGVHGVLEGGSWAQALALPGPMVA